MQVGTVTLEMLIGDHFRAELHIQSMINLRGVMDNFTLGGKSAVSGSLLASGAVMKTEMACRNRCLQAARIVWRRLAWDYDNQATTPARQREPEASESLCRIVPDEGLLAILLS